MAGGAGTHRGDPEGAPDLHPQEGANGVGHLPSHTALQELHGGHD